MKTLRDIADRLRLGLKETQITQSQLGADAGISRRTLTHLLSGQADYKVTTLMATLDRLGLEMTIVPRAALAGIGTSFEPSAPVVKTRVQAALERSRSRSGKQ